MSEIPSPTNPEKAEVIEDNARKFVIASRFTHEFLDAHNATSYLLISDWISTGAINEEKLVYKKFENDDTQILFISKSTINGSRTSRKEKISEEEYGQLLQQSKVNVRKLRSEFEYVQDGQVYDMKYDEFDDGGLRVLEVDAPTDEARASFKAIDFPVEVNEVTGDISYYGYRVADVLNGTG